MDARSQSPRPQRLIRPSSGLPALRLGELWRYRELIYFLTWRDIKVRYRQTILGVAWAIIQPFMTMVVFSIFFGELAGVPSDDIPYPIFAYTALIPWTFFATGLNQASNNIIGGASLIRNIYFPRLALPIASVFGAVPDMVIAMSILLGMMVVYSLYPSAVALVLLPVFLALAFLTALGVGFWLSALNVQYRDIRFAVPFVIQFWFFATPIAYPASLLDQPWRTLYGLNPMVGVIEAFRWSLLGSGEPPGPMVLVSALVTLTVFVSGLYYFRHMEKSFADVI
jgi:lipopolysaccharide transport system permease protein